MSLSVAGNGKLDWPAARLGFDPDQLQIEKVAIEDGRIAFSDGASGTQTQLEGVLVQGRPALAAWAGERRGRFHGRAASATATAFAGSRVGRRRHEDQARPRSRRSAARHRGRRRGAVRRQRSALRGHADARAAGCGRGRERAWHRRDAVAREREGEGHSRAGAVRTARIPVRAGRARHQADRHGRVAFRQGAALRRRAVGAAGRPRSRAGAAGGVGRLPLAALKAFIEPLAVVLSPAIPGAARHRRRCGDARVRDAAEPARRPDARQRRLGHRDARIPRAGFCAASPQRTRGAPGRR